MLRASSLVAVTILVWSTSENLRSCVSLRTTWRQTNMSCSVCSVSVSSVGGAKAIPTIDRRQEMHSAVDVQRRANTLERQAQFDERDGHGRLHADHDRRRVQ